MRFGIRRSGIARPGGRPRSSATSARYAEAQTALNEAMLVIAMIETPQAVANADAIAAVPGIDALLIGTQRSHPRDGHLGPDRARAGRGSV